MNRELLGFVCESHLRARWSMEKLLQQWGSWHLCLAIVQACLLFFLWCCLRISLQRMQPYCCSIVCVLRATVGVLSMHMLVCACVSGVCVKEKVSEQESQRQVLHDHSPLFSYSSTDASLPYCPAWLLTVMSVRECEWKQGGGEISKQMAKHWLWPHLWGDLCTQHAGVCVRALHSNGIPVPISVSPVSP